MQIIRSYLHFGLVYIWSFLAFVVPFLFAFLIKDRMFVPRIWGRGHMFLAKWVVGITYRIEGLDNLPNYPCIVASKHQSAWETMALCTMLKQFNFVLKKELTNIPFMGFWLRRMGAVPVSRDGSMADIKNMLSAAKASVERGDNLIIFPEGTRQPVGAEPDYKGGISLLYAKLDMDVIPVALNSGKYWSKFDIKRKKGEIAIKFLPKITKKSQSGLKKDDFMKQLQDAIETESNNLFGG